MCVCVCVWSGWVRDLTAVRSRSTGRGRACSHRGDLDLGHRSSLSDTCHTEGPLCCAGSSVAGRTHGSFSYMDATPSGKEIFDIFGDMPLNFLELERKNIRTFVSVLCKYQAKAST